MFEEKSGLLVDEECSDSSHSFLDHTPWHQMRCRAFCNGFRSYYVHLTPFGIYFLIIHALCFLSGILVLVLLAHRSNLAILDFDNRYPDWVPVSYQLRAKYSLETPQNGFTGMPNDQNTKAWDDVITPTYFSASQDELEKIGESVHNSVPLATGGYLAGLGVYHDIHCLRRLRLFLHSNYYYRTLTDMNMDYLREHLGHCIESLRRTVMCKADVNVFTFTWDDAELIKPGVWRPMPKSNQERKCVNWNELEDWVTERHVPLHPVLLRRNGEKEKILMV